jgi:hypothetical protein
VSLIASSLSLFYSLIFLAFLWQSFCFDGHLRHHQRSFLGLPLTVENMIFVSVTYILPMHFPSRPPVCLSSFMLSLSAPFLPFAVQPHTSLKNAPRQYYPPALRVTCFSLYLLANFFRYFHICCFSRTYISTMHPISAYPKLR